MYAAMELVRVSVPAWSHLNTKRLLFWARKKFQVVEETGRGWKTPKNHLEIVWWLIRGG